MPSSLRSAEPEFGDALVVERPGRGETGILAHVFRLFDEAGLRYCVLHGYESLGVSSGSDVDCVVDARFGLRAIYELLHANEGRIGADIVRCRNGLVQLAGWNQDGTRCFVSLDLSADAGCGHFTFRKGRDVLESRRRFGDLWVPSAAIEFGSYLARSLVKGRLGQDRLRRLERLFREDPSSCAREVARLWRGRDAKLILAAGESGDWSQVHVEMRPLRARLIRNVLFRHPVRYAASMLDRAMDRAGRLLRPEGLSVVVLGPDGAGKSSTTDALAGPKLMPVFDRSVVWGFVPPLHRLIGRNLGPASDPHALPPRSLANSLMRATYWFLFLTLGHARVHLALARSGLVLYDRHFVDIFVDPKRYRYSGPNWPLALIWHLSPRPKLIVLLDGPAEMIQARKQEVPVAETARQLEAYRTLVGSLPNGIIVDGTKPFDVVTDTIAEHMLRHLRQRLARRLSPRPDPAAAARAGVGRVASSVLRRPEPPPHQVGGHKG